MCVILLQIIKRLHMSVSSCEKPWVSVITSMVIPPEQRHTENRQLCRSALQQIFPESVGLHLLETSLDLSGSGYQLRLYYFKYTSVHRLPEF